MTRAVLITVLMCGLSIAAALPCSAQPAPGTSAQTPSDTPPQPAQETTAQSTPDAPPQPAPGALLDWAREKAIALDTIHPGGSTSDLEPLKALVGDARIVLLGDSRHDAREQWLLKARIIEYLVKNMGFSVLAMEESLPCTSGLNACLLGERDDMDVALSEIGAWYLWDTEELLALMSALRAHNKEIATDQSNEESTTGPAVRVYGIDISEGARPGVKHALATLALADTGAADRLRRAIDLSPISKNFWPQSMQNYGALAPEAADSLGAGLADLVNALADRKQSLIAQTGEAQYEWALRQAIVAKQAHEMMLTIVRSSYEEAGALRETAMVDNLSWLLRVAAPGEKVIVWAHNFHVARAPQHLDIPGAPSTTMDPLGSLLAKEYGDSMVTIGFSFDRGVDSTALKPTAEGWVDNVLGRVGPDAFILDLRTAPPEGPAHDWLNAEQSMRGEGGKAILAPAKAFDAIAFVRETGPITRSARALARFATLNAQ